MAFQMRVAGADKKIIPITQYTYIYDEYMYYNTTQELQLFTKTHLHAFDKYPVKIASEFDVGRIRSNTEIGGHRGRNVQANKPRTNRRRYL